MSSEWLSSRLLGPADLPTKLIGLFLHLLGSY